MTPRLGTRRRQHGSPRRCPGPLPVATRERAGRDRGGEVVYDPGGPIDEQSIHDATDKRPWWRAANAQVVRSNSSGSVPLGRQAPDAPPQATQSRQPGAIVASAPMGSTICDTAALPRSTPPCYSVRTVRSLTVRTSDRAAMSRVCSGCRVLPFTSVRFGLNMSAFFSPSSMTWRPIPNSPVRPSSHS